MRDFICRFRNVITVAFALGCLFFLTCGVRSQQLETITVDTELVSLNVVALDRQGRPVRGLTKEDFEVFEDGKPQEITHFAADERPLRLVLLFDTSLSMETVLPDVRRQAGALLGALRPKDEVSMISFASDVRSLSDWVDPEQAKTLLGLVTPEPHSQPVPAAIGHPGYRIGDQNTNLYEALQHVLSHFKGDSTERIAVVVFSDGVDTVAGRNIDRIRERATQVGAEVRRYAQESWALLYPIRYRTEQIIGDTPRPAWRPLRGITIGSRPDDPGRKLLSQIATSSGGEVFEWTTQSDLNAAVVGVLSDLRSQYGIGYKPPSSGDRRGFHRVKIRVKRPGMVARTRDGYLLP